MKDVVIIGGGISGLCAAYRLSKAGLPITLIDPAPTLGGVISSSVTDGFTLEHGPNVLLGKREVIGLVTELGIASEMIYPIVDRYQRYVWCGGAVHKVPASPTSFIGTRLIPHLVKPGILVRALKKGSLAPKDDDESIRIFMDRLLGEVGTQSIVEPALRGIYGGEIDHLSARSLFVELWSHLAHGNSMISFMRGKERARMFVLRGGINVLVQTLLRIVLPRVRVIRQAVESVERRPDSGFEVRLSDNDTIQAGKVFIATSGNRTAKYLSELSPNLAERLSRVRFAAIAVVHCSVPREAPVPPRSFGILFPPGLPSQILGVMYNTSLFPHLAPSDKHLLTVCFGGVGAQAVCDLSDDDLFAEASAELREKLEFTVIERLAVTRWRSAIPQYEIGHFRLLEAMHDVEEANPGMYFIGADTGGVGVADRVRTALKRSEEVISKCNVEHSVARAAGIK